MKDFLGKKLRKCGKKKDFFNNTVVIAVMGTESGVGTTHLCITISNFLAYVKNRKVELVEVNNTGDISKINMINSDALKDFIVTSNMKNSNLHDSKADFVVADLSLKRPEAINIFLQADIKILVGGVNLWKMNGWILAFELLKDRLEVQNITCLSLDCDRHVLKELRAYGYNIELIPIEKDVFLLNSKNIKWIEELIY